MPRLLRVLLIEDSEFDATLILRLLVKGGYDLHHQRIETSAELASALESDWELIIADYNLPQFSAPAALEQVKATGRDIHVGAVVLGVVEKNLTNDAQDVAEAFLRRDVFLDFVSEEDQSDFVVVPNGRECEDGCNLGGEFALGLLTRTEDSGAGKIDNQHHSELPLLDKLLDERVVHARRNIPINRADFIAGLVLANFIEVHSLALENAMVLTRQRFIHKPKTAQLDLPNLF